MNLPWYIARSAGLVAWTLLAASVVWGLILSTKVFGKRPRPAWVLDLHRYLGGLAVVFVAVHIAGIMADRYVDFGWVQTFVPLASSWRPVAVAWGVVSLYVLLAVEITSLLRHRIPETWWRRTHVASFALFVMSAIHALSAGTDASTRAMQWWILGGIAMVSGLVAVRLATRGNRSRATDDRRERLAALRAGSTVQPAPRRASTR